MKKDVAHVWVNAFKIIPQIQLINSAFTSTMKLIWKKAKSKLDQNGSL